MSIFKLLIIFFCFFSLKFFFFLYLFCILKCYTKARPSEVDPLPRTDFSITRFDKRLFLLYLIGWFIGIVNYFFFFNIFWGELWKYQCCGRAAIHWVLVILQNVKSTIRVRYFIPSSSCGADSTKANQIRNNHDTFIHSVYWSVINFRTDLSYCPIA